MFEPLDTAVIFREDIGAEKARRLHCAENKDPAETGQDPRRLEAIVPHLDQCSGSYSTSPAGVSSTNCGAIEQLRVLRVTVGESARSRRIANETLVAARETLFSWRQRCGQCVKHLVVTLWKSIR